MDKFRYQVKPPKSKSSKLYEQLSRVYDTIAGINFTLISEGNAKTGPSFSLQSITTCHWATLICMAICYGGYGNMAYAQNRKIRDNRTLWVYRNLANGLFTALMILELTRLHTLGLLTTLRIHDLGDFFSPSYVRAWYQICSCCPFIRFWAYTRAYPNHAMALELRKLASLPNVSIWLSADSENYSLALMEFIPNSNTYKGIAVMQTDDYIPESALKIVPLRNLVIFPSHAHGGSIRKGFERSKSGPKCPAITKPDGFIKKLESRPDLAACQVCQKCLPSG